jgi:hypothetical protein
MAKAGRDLSLCFLFRIFGRRLASGAKRSQQRNQPRKVSQPLPRSVIRVYDEAGNVIETHEHSGELKE